MGGLTPPRPIAENDDVAGFDCGNAALNTWLRQHGWRNQQGGGSRTSVIVDDASGRIAGFVSLSATAVRRELLPKSIGRNQPEPVPAVLLGQLAVDREWQRQGVARSLLYFALHTAVRVADDLGCVSVATHPIDEAARAFYLRHGFVGLPGDPGMLAVKISALRASGF